MENDISDDSDDYPYSSCHLKRSDSLREALLEPPTAETVQNRLEIIINISGRFVEDVNVILEKCGSSIYVVMILKELVIDLAKNLKGDKDTITVDSFNHSTSNNMPDFKRVDQMHTFQTILLRELPPERIGAIINLILATRQCATTEEIEDSLRYLYDSGSYVEIANLPPLPSKDLTADDMNNAHVNEITMKKLKSIIDLRSQVIEDVSAMFETFPHDNVVTQALFSFITDLVENLHGNTTRIDALSIKEYANIEESDPNIINAVESVLSTRLDENVYCGLINLMNAFSPNTSEDDIQTALEYLYGPKDDI